MSDLKTKKNKADVNKFLDKIADERKRDDCKKILKIMLDITGDPGSMWGPSIIGFGSYHYKYASGREGDWMLVGFSPRKQNITLYIMSGFDHYDELLGKLGKHTTAKSCLYIKKLEDIDIDVLKKLIKASVEHMSKTHNA